ncbi:hypothetical protein BELL_0467g00080 [Botrytis elliptica]|uniref:DUF7907 domain-containing protein n=1 Tax=Botrytis elliptica TaxID=278938 RepID=A0A4Z1JLG3_9HELO|nr:hypothetical protein EAE99_000881 [Botrytis elliptica]TGO72330.1 hypothetical protein BELL_0467g00080 [Botrytis elliptica]
MVQIKQHILSALAPIAALFSPSPSPMQSAPFTLSVVSENKYLDGSYIHGCHTGAAQTALCAFPKCHARHGENSPTTFYFNVSAPLGPHQPSGSLVYNLPYDTDKFLSQSAKMEFNRYTHDFAHPLFAHPDDTEGIFVFHHDRLHLKDHREQRWYICGGYSPFSINSFPILVWYHGVGDPRAECVKVEIKRAFV